MAKFVSLDNDGNGFDHDYGNIYFRQPCGDRDRLVIGPTNSQVALLDRLAATFPTQQYYILYVLLGSHAGRRRGRYHSPLIESHEDLQLFIWTFQNFFEGDGRHNVWIATPNSRNLLIYDQHNVIFAYGDLDAFQRVLDDGGYQNKEFWFPHPHAHHYHPANVNAEDELMAYFDWQYFDLQPVDELG